jgi:xanthine dehydrogenase YagS FAD-binding subunit
LKNFEYAIPENVEKAFEYLQPSGTTIKSGGIDLVDLMKEDLVAPKRLVSIRDLQELKFIRRESDGSVVIGPAITLTEVAENKLLSGSLQALAQAASGVAIPQIRNSATLGGNLCQRPRCWYFRSIDFDCLRKGGDTCFALDGENQYHAIVGNTDGCVIVHPSAIAVALMALDAQLSISDGDKTRTIPITEFFVEPAKDITKENILKPNEMILKVSIPSDMGNYKSFYYKHKEKESFDWPLADVAVALKFNGNVCSDARIVLGSVAPVPVRANEAEKALMGKTIDKNIAANAAKNAVTNANPLSLNGYKVPICETIVYRTVCLAAEIDPFK